MTNEKEKAENLELAQEQESVVAVTNNILADVRAEAVDKMSYSVPITELASLGAGVASLIPAFNTVTQTSAVDATGLYRLVNAEAGDTLKIAKGGDSWGALKRADGTSKMAKFRSAGALTETNTVTLPINPATMMMAAALFSIEQELGQIEETQRQILSFMENEKESEIEADVETLLSMIEKYKFNWDNEHYLQSSHKLVLDIQRTARKNMLSYQKRVAEGLASKRMLVAHSNVKSALNDLLKKFKYYRLSLYAFSLASLLEILLSGNFGEEYISEVKEEVESLAMNYRDLFEKCSGYLEKMESSALESKALKGLGVVSNAAGKFIGSIPKIKEGQVDEFLQESGERLQVNADRMGQSVLESFAGISNPGTGVLTAKMRDLIQIYNHTAEICFDQERMYLIAE